MISYVCDWCQRELPLNGISKVTVKNVYNKKVRLHICRDCGRSHMPQHVQSNLSWTADD